MLMERGGWSGSGREKGADAWRKGGGGWAV